MSQRDTEQRILNAITTTTTRGLHEVTRSKGLTVEELSDQLWLDRVTTRVSIASLWARGLVRADTDGRLIRGRSPDAPCGARMRDGRYCIRTFGHEGSCKPE